MPRLNVKQPNGKYAIFSTVVDDFIGFNVEPRQIADTMEWEEAVKNAIRTYGKVPETIKEAISFGLISEERIQEILKEIQKESERS